MATQVQLSIPYSSLELKQIHEQDKDALWILIDTERDYLRKYLNWIDNTRTLDDVSTFIKNCTQQTDRLKGITFLIWEENQIIGSVALYDWQHDVKLIHLGYWVSKAATRRGIATVASTRLLRYAFDDLDMLKVELYFVPENIASERVADKLRFKIEGFVRQSFFLNGIIKDQYLAGLLKAEFLYQL